MSLIIVERSFEQSQTDSDLDAAAKRGKPCNEIHSVTWRRSVMSRDRRRIICEYEAPDVETVRRAQLESGNPFDRIWAAEVLE